MSIEPWPALSTKRSRLAQRGSRGLKRMCRLQRTNAAGAQPIGMPGWPLFAFSMASMARKRMVLMGFCCSSGVLGSSQGYGDRGERRARAPLARERFAKAPSGQPIEHPRRDAPGDVDAAARERLEREV